MALQEGAKIDVIIKNKYGRVDILVTDTKGLTIYMANSATSGNFSIQIPKTDTYKFSVTGRKAKGGISFKISE